MTTGSVQLVIKAGATNLVSKIVAVALTSSWFANWYVDWLTHFLSADFAARGIPLKGDLSEWIQRLEAQEFLKQLGLSDVPGFATCIELVSKFLCDPRELWPLIKDLEKLGCSETFLKETNADLRNGDFDRVNRH